MLAEFVEGNSTRVRAILDVPITQACTLYQRRLPFRQGSECVEMKWMSRPWRPRTQHFAHSKASTWGLRESRMNCHTQVGKIPCRSEGHTMQRAEFSRTLCGVAAVSEKSGVWLGRTSGLIDGRASGERSPASTLQTNACQKVQRIVFSSFLLRWIKPARPSNVCFFLRCVIFYLNTAQIRGNHPQSSRPSSMMIRPTCPLPTPSRGPSRTSTIPRTCTFVS